MVWNSGTSDGFTLPVAFLYNATYKAAELILPDTSLVVQFHPVHMGHRVSPGVIVKVGRYACWRLLLRLNCLESVMRYVKQYFVIASYRLS